MQVFINLLKLVAPKWKSMLLAAFFSVLTVVSNIGLLAISALLISKAALHPPILFLMTLIVGVRFFGISRAVFRYLERYISHDTTFRILKEIRIWFYSRLEPLAPAALTNYKSGELLANLVNNIETLQHFYLRVIAPPVTALIIFTGVFTVLAWFHLKIALTFALFYLLASVGTPLLIKILSQKSDPKIVEVKTDLNVHLVDCIQGMTELTVFGQKENYQQKAKILGQKLVSLQGKEAKLTGLANTLTSIFANLSLWAVLVMTIPLVEKGKLSGTNLAMLALTSFSSFEATYALPHVTNHLAESLAAGKKLFQISASRPKVKENNYNFSFCKPQNASIRIENLSFRYAEDEPWVLKNINLEISVGERVALIGPSGAGKSTLINLLLRFWDYETGKIYLGEHDLKEYAPEKVRSMFSIVDQKTHLFNGTIEENLLLARPTAIRAEIIKACQDAQIHDFINGLPQGYETFIGENGLKLSGGQRQRLAIARAILKDAPILILDEATNGLDPITEQQIWQNLTKIMERKSNLIITHRLTGLEKPDKILMLDERGEIKKIGSFKT